jgi:short-subunit dehydrogenase
MRSGNRLKGQVVVITGASSGIGLASAINFSSEGAIVVLIARDKKALARVAKDCQSAKVKTLSIGADVTDVDSMRYAAQTAFKRFGRIDVWVNNAVVAQYGDFENIPLVDFHRVMDTAFFGCVNGTAAVLPYFRRQGHGRLINIASVLGTIGIPHMSSYVAAKHAVIGFSESLRQELSGSGIDVCVVAPASIDTPFYRHAANLTGRELRPLPPVFTPERVAERIVQLAKRPRKLAFVPNSAALVPIARAIAPNLAERIAKYLINNYQFGSEPAAPTVGNLYSPRNEETAARKTRIRRLRELGGLVFGTAMLLGLAWGNQSRQKNAA